ncbi:hypothetical protein F4810DRAFT_692857 [Camillea tinctor]|nr:hypothetical protein F4810DRAFT_692857 [Camillea tinctor]
MECNVHRLVSVALSFDAFVARDPRTTHQLCAAMPLYNQLSYFLAAVNDRNNLSQPSLCGEVLMQQECVTKFRYENLGLGMALNRFVTLEARARGYKGISACTDSKLLASNWMNPPVGRSHLVSNWIFEELEFWDENRKVVMPYEYIGPRRGWKIWCDLTGESEVS